MAGLGLKGSLRELVHAKFAAARDSRDLLFSETQLSILKTKCGVPFQLRYCPGLAKKPKDNSEPKADTSRPRPDPFENPSPELLVSEIHDGSHILVLNKYPVIPNHFILATRTSKPQTHLLEPDDLTVAYDCIKEWQSGIEDTQESSLFAFFNSGEHSGASQPHRHLQFLPVEDMKITNSHDEHSNILIWSPLTDTMASDRHESAGTGHTFNARLPFQHFATALSRETSASLYAKYVELLRLALAPTRTSADSDADQDEEICICVDGRVAFSYNLAMTRNIMAICPRQSETATIPGMDASHTVSINGTILGGTLMVKEQQEWDTLRSIPGVLDSILETVGFPKSISSAPRNLADCPGISSGPRM